MQLCRRRDGGGQGLVRRVSASHHGIRLAQSAIRLLYSATAGSLYDRVVVRGAFPLFGGHMPELVIEQGRAAAEDAGAMPILDMPVGTAVFAAPAALLHEGLVVGVDIAGGMVTQARKTAEDSGASNLSVVQADAHRLPFPDESFGAVVSSNGLQVIPGAEAALGELVRVLAPGKRLYLSVVTLPLGAALSRGSSGRLPIVLSSSAGIVDALINSGLSVASVKRERLALLAEAVKPVRGDGELGRLAVSPAGGP